MTIKIDPILALNAKQVVEHIMLNVKSVKAVVIATEDGFEIAAKAENNSQSSRLSAMASSFSALGSLVGEESQLGQCNNVIIDAAEGFILIFQIRRPVQNMTMCVVAGKDAVMGQLLYSSRQAAQSLAAA